MRLPRTRRGVVALVLTVPALALATGEVHAQAPAAGPAAPVSTGVMQVGEAKAVAQSVRYGADADKRIFQHPGATYIKVHFTELRLAAGEYLTVTDAAGGQQQTFRSNPRTSPARTGNSDHTVHGPQGFGAMSIDGDTAVVQLHSPNGAAPRATSGVGVDKFWRGYTPAEIRAHNPAMFSVCNTDARKDVVCYRLSRPTEYARAGAVARQLLNGSGWCTTWRVGKTNRMMTNNHCAPNAAAIASSEVQFGYECQTCGGNNPGATVKVSGAEFLKTNSSLDFTLFSVNNFASIEKFGTLFLETRRPVAGELIYIPGHGDTKPKRLSFHEETDIKQRCTIKSAVTGQNTGYTCDTSGGNSGSPVIAAAAHKVIALHWGGGGCSQNVGTRTELIYPQVSALIDNNG